MTYDLTLLSRTTGWTTCIQIQARNVYEAVQEAADTNPETRVIKAIPHV